eukprot:comp22181_c0_seq1/m.32581 comp22181_c0_seq1/g.32581  ORF comp22181_c0_seq1/g.32581 comp22181_c0_seq1/m.32581 type:complete len:379 (-) comp22181_c0_seq1:308-1444(-)
MVASHANRRTASFNVRPIHLIAGAVFFLGLCWYGPHFFGPHEACNCDLKTENYSEGSKVPETWSSLKLQTCQSCAVLKYGDFADDFAALQNKQVIGFVTPDLTVGQDRAHFRLVIPDPQGTVFGDIIFGNQNNMWQVGVMRNWVNTLGSRCVRADGTRQLVVDVGGHVGFTSMLAASMGCRVVAFEPVGRQARFWKVNAHLNKFEDRMLLMKNAVSTVKGQVVMATESNGLSSHVSGVGSTNPKDSYAESKETVETVELMDVLQPTEDVLLMKFDVEGHEYFAWKSGLPLFKANKARNVMMEYNPSLIGYEKSLEIMTTMIDYGYTVWEVLHYPPSKIPYRPYKDVAAFVKDLFDCKLNRDPPCSQIDVMFTIDDPSF